MNRTSRMGWCALAAGALLWMAGDVLAQARGSGDKPRAGAKAEGGGSGAGKDEPVRLRRVDPRGTQVETPEFRTTATTGSGMPKKWQLFAASYDTAPEWIDELSFQYYVMTGPVMVTEKKVFSFFTARVTYVDVEKGRHTSDVYLRPATVKRWGAPVAIGVEVYRGDKLVAVETATSIPMPSKQWWKDPKVTEVDSVVKRDGLLLNRAQTPFACIDVDAYEMIK
jgi:hypothetical protein